METHVLVRTEHLNHFGSLFGGQMLLWVDESAAMTALTEFPHVRLITRALSNVEFKKQIINGSVCKFVTKRIGIGNTSVRYDVKVYAHPPEQEKSELVFQTEVTFVAIDEKGQKKDISDVKPIEYPD